MYRYKPYVAPITKFILYELGSEFLEFHYSNYKEQQCNHAISKTLKSYV